VPIIIAPFSYISSRINRAIDIFLAKKRLSRYQILDNWGDRSKAGAYKAKY